MPKKTNESTLSQNAKQELSLFNDETSVFTQTILAYCHDALNNVSTLQLAISHLKKTLNDNPNQQTRISHLLNTIENSSASLKQQIEYLNHKALPQNQDNSNKDNILDSKVLKRSFTPPEQKPYDLIEFIYNLIEVSKLKTTEVNYNFKFTQKSIIVKYPQYIIYNAIQNIINNSLEALHMNLTQKSKELNISLELDDKSINIIFRNNGGHIPLFVLEKLSAQKRISTKKNHQGLGFLNSKEQLEKIDAQLIIRNKEICIVEYVIMLNRYHE